MVLVAFSLILLQALSFTTIPALDLPHGHEYISRTFSIDWSFGICLTRDLNALHRLAWTYLAPAYLLIMVLLSYWLSHFYRFRRVFCRSTVIKMFWQFILLSFSSLASTSFQLMKCIDLHPKNVFTDRGVSNWRFADDASIVCFSGEHLIWAVVATVIVAVFCIPLPLSLPFLHKYHRLIPFADIYSSLYKDNRRWWCSIDLLRRLVFAAIYTAEDDPENSHLAMVQVCLGLILLQMVMWPFESHKANIVEGALLCSLTAITILSGPEITWGRAIAIETTFFTTVVVLLVFMVWEDGKLKLWMRKAPPSPGYRVPALDEEDDGTMLRDRLLADPYCPKTSETLEQAA